MPKRKQGTHPKAESARTKKAGQKAALSLAEERARVDAYWEDDDKLGQRKLQRKTEREVRRLDEVGKRAELRKIEAEESELLASEAKPKVKLGYYPPAIKVTQAEIQTRITSATSPAHKPCVPMVTELPLKENINHTLNRLDPEKNEARSVDEALLVLKHSYSPLATQVAFSKFEKENLPRLRDCNPSLRMSQVKQLLKKEWMRSPENPSNQIGACKL